VAVIYSANGFGLIMLLHWYHRESVRISIFYNLVEEIINSVNPSRKKRTVCPITCHKVSEGEKRSSSTLPLTSVLAGDG
jgi:hypothetical protein